MQETTPTMNKVSNEWKKQEIYVLNDANHVQELIRTNTLVWLGEGTPAGGGGSENVILRGDVPREPWFSLNFSFHLEEKFAAFLLL